MASTSTPSGMSLIQTNPATVMRQFESVKASDEVKDHPALIV